MAVYGGRMRDRDVRAALHGVLERRHADEMASTLFVDELGLCGSVRVDVAVVNGALSGFELKSASDTLTRLPKQVEVYSQVLDYSTLVVAENHLAKADAMLPSWWGCIVATQVDGRLELETVRPPTMSPVMDPFALAQLLWRDEALTALEGLGLAEGVRSKSRQHLWDRLAQELEVSGLRDLVRQTLKARTKWRSPRETRADLALA